EKVTIVYRRSKLEMPAREAEYHHAVQEGINFQFLTNPVEFLGDNGGDLKEMKVIKMRLGEPDAKGKPRPIPIKGSEFSIETDMAIIAIGTMANRILINTISELKLNSWGYIDTDKSGHTNIPDIFAGGDIVTGSATVISAMGTGRVAADAIDDYISSTHSRT
ncbi:MAG: dihydropyrimidine dehydrogenase, partial [Candidatus Lokiarchaeota archaeon]|nr:dihydropyrimidine dehydrogenase [Candidatus Lokiarchaeota archaeon]MBD3199460.1 dihydropyrimidine dehydrogenase [Candidatus Lokiarchaeota archaeon]